MWNAPQCFEMALHFRKKLTNAHTSSRSTRWAHGTAEDLVGVHELQKGEQVVALLHILRQALQRQQHVVKVARVVAALQSTNAVK